MVKYKNGVKYTQIGIYTNWDTQSVQYTQNEILIQNEIYTPSKVYYLVWEAMIEKGRID